MEARQAALAGVKAATAFLSDLEARAAAARELLARQAVDAYIASASTSSLTAFLGARSFAEGGERAALVSVAQDTASDALAAYRNARQDAMAARRALDAATPRQGAGQAQAPAAAGQDPADSGLPADIASLRRESAALSAQEAQLEAMIRAEEGADASHPPGLEGAPVAPARPTSAAGLIWPVHGPVTSPFGRRWGGFHPGIDIAPGYGTPIAAAKDGTVVFAGYYGGYGLFVLIDHGGGMVTGYAHQSAVAVSVGQVVHQGQIIGYVGSSGDSTGPHLHFEVRINATPQNPRDFETGDP